MPNSIEAALDTEALGEAKQTRTCPFCQPFLGRAGREPWNKILYETPNFLVLPSKGAIVAGWLLVIPKKHSLCFGELHPAHSIELRNLLDRLRGFITSSYGVSPTIFEHGPVAQFSTLGCGIDHAHFHLVPLDFSLSQCAAVKALQWVPAGENLEALNISAREGAEYLFLWESLSRPLLARPKGLPSQFFRRVIAEAIGRPEEFDYRTHFHENNVLSSLGRFSVALLWEG